MELAPRPTPAGREHRLEPFKVFAAGRRTPEPAKAVLSCNRGGRLGAEGVLPAQSLCRAAVIGSLALAGQVVPTVIAEAEAQGYSSPTYAASAEGSPYASGTASPHSNVYARTFGSSGQAAPAATPGAAVPIVAPSALQRQPDKLVSDELVYVINSKGLLTFRAADFAEGKEEAIAHNPVPLPIGPNGGPAAPPLVPSVANNLYLRPPLETAAGADTPAPPP